MSRPKSIHNRNICEDCGVYIHMARYEKAKLCAECKSDRRAGNQELKQLFKEMSKRKEVVEEESDWSGQNIKTNDDALYRHRRFE